MLTRSSTLLRRAAPGLLSRRATVQPQPRHQSTFAPSDDSLPPSSTSDLPIPTLAPTPFPPSLLTSLSNLLHTHTSQLSSPSLSLLNKVARLLQTVPQFQQLKALRGEEGDQLVRAAGALMGAIEGGRPPSSPSEEEEEPASQQPPTNPARPPLTRKERSSLRHFLHQLSWSPSSPLPPPTLGQDKLRLLLTLYHSTPSFPHPDDLDSAIDPVLAPAWDTPPGGELTATDLKRLARNRTGQPVLSVPGRQSASTAGLGLANAVSGVTGPMAEEDAVAAGRREGRSGRVLDALAGAGGRVQPGGIGRSALAALGVGGGARGAEQSFAAGLGLEEERREFGLDGDARRPLPGVENVREEEGRGLVALSQQIVKVKLRGERELYRPKRRVR